MEELNTIEKELKERQAELDKILLPEDIYNRELAKLEKQYSAKVEKLRKEIATIEALREEVTAKTTQEEKDLIEANNEEINKKIKSKNNSLNRITANYEKKKRQLETDRIEEEANYKIEKYGKEKEIKVVKIRLLKAIENSRKEAEEKEQEAIAKMEKAKQDFREKVKKQKRLEEDIALIKKIKQDFKGISAYTNAGELRLQMDETTKETMKQLRELAKERTQIWEDKIKFEKEAQEARENKETVMAKIDDLMKKYSLQEIELEEEQKEEVFKDEPEETDVENKERKSVFDEPEEAVFEDEPEETDVENKERKSVFDEPEEAVFEDEPEETDVENKEGKSVFDEPEEAVFEDEPEETDVENKERKSVFDEPEEVVFEDEPEELTFDKQQDESPRLDYILRSIALQLENELTNAGLKDSELYTALLLKEISQKELFAKAIGNHNIPEEQLEQTKQEMENYYKNWDALEAAEKMLEIKQKAGNAEDYAKLQNEVAQLQRYRIMQKLSSIPKSAEPVKPAPTEKPKPVEPVKPAPAEKPKPVEPVKPAPAEKPKSAEPVKPAPVENPKSVEPVKQTPESEQAKLPGWQRQNITQRAAQPAELELIEVTCFTKAGYYHFTFSDGTTIGINQSTRLNGRAESIIKEEVESKIAKTDNMANTPDYMLIEAMSDAFFSKERKSPDSEKTKIRENTEKTIKEYLDAIRTGKQETGIPVILYDGITGIEEINEELRNTLNYNEKSNREIDLCELKGAEKYRMSKIIKQAEQIGGFITIIEKRPNKLLEMLKNLKLKATNTLHKVKLKDKERSSEESLKETKGEEENSEQPLHITSENDNDFFSRIEATDKQKESAVKIGQKAADQTPIAEFTVISEEAEKGQEPQ